MSWSPLVSLMGKPIQAESSDLLGMQEVEKEVEEHEPGKKPKKKTITAMEYLYEADLEGKLTCTLLRLEAA